MKPARFLLEAQDEFLEQISYYEEQQKGLGDRFRESVEAATDLASTHPKLGSPQGGVISPLLSNIYLHHVMDTWFEDEIKPKLRGEALLVRYADDIVIVFEDADDARRVMDVLPMSGKNERRPRIWFAFKPGSEN